MRFSVWPNLQQPWADVAAVAAQAEASGWHGVWIADHFMGDGGGFGPVETPTLEATAVLAALAAGTERLRLGSLVFGATYRHPAVLANWASSVDHLSDGRLVLGVGAGWQENEHEQYGIDLSPVRDRITRFAEYCQVLNALLRTERTTFSGDWYELAEARCEPKPVQPRLPLLVGGKGDRMLGITADHADVWNMWALPDQFAERSGVLDRRCEAIGRDPTEIERTTQALVLLTDDATAASSFVEAVAPRAAVAGTVEQIADTVEAWQAVGVDELIVPDFVLGRGSRRAEALDALIETLLPRFGGPAPAATTGTPG